MPQSAEERSRYAAERPFTVDVPGLRDIFILPNGPAAYPTWKEAKEQGYTREQWEAMVPKWVRDYRRERVIRMKTARSPVPEPLRWIPQVIKHIDDAQDILYTALVLAKPIIRRLPARFLPGVGWILLLNDMMNLTVTVLGTIHSGPSGKIMVKSLIGGTGALRRARAKALQKFLGRTPWLPFALQAGQAMESLTGYGLRLGGIMGMISDAKWGIVRALQGYPVKVRYPRDGGLIEKAASIALRAMTGVWYQNVLSKWEEAIIMAGTAAAIHILDEVWEPWKLEERADTLAKHTVPIWEIDDEEVLQDLEDAGIPTDPDEWRPYHPLAEDAPMVDVVRAAVETEDTWALEQKRRYEECEAGGIIQIIHEQAGEVVWDHIGGVRGNLEYEQEDVYLALRKAVEYDIRPIGGVPQEKVWEWLETSQKAAREGGLDFPTTPILRKYANEIMGGWTRFTP